jgi:transmembrane sensor
METLVKRLQDGTCTPEEAQLFRRWIASLDISDPSIELPAEQLTVLRERMHRQLMQEIQGEKAIPIKQRSLLRKYAVAACVVLLVGAGMLFLYLSNLPARPSDNALSSLTIIDNNQHVVRKVTMPDGTTIWLNSDARLEFDASLYNQRQRAVKLYGEGFFEVTENAAKPFIVVTGNIQTRVLGTAFNIEAWQHESEIRVSLVRGKVALKNTSNAATAVLAPDQTMRYSKQTGEWVVLPMAVNHIQDWTSGALVFNEVPLEEALKRMAWRFHLTLDYDQKILLNKRITASFQTASWQTALHNILFVHGLHFSTVKGRVVITH